jgi:rubrerythrin
MEGIDDNIPESDNGIEYTVQLDVPNINHLLNMYNMNPMTGYNNTSNTPNPLPFSSLNTENSYNCPADNISELYDNIEPLYLSDVKSMKGNIRDILSKRSDFKDEDYDDEKYENKEIDELYEKIKGMNEEFKTLQDTLYKSEENLNFEIDKLKSNEMKLNNFITFLESLSSLEYSEIKPVIDNINILSTKLSNLESFKKAKKDYATERKNILKYIYLLRKVNKMNVTNICVVCMDDPVTHFITPCGHTFCKKCLETHLEMNDINNTDTISNDKKCPICRKYVLNVNPLYFL